MDKKASGLKRLVSATYRFALSKKKLHVIFQNQADRDAFVNNKLLPAEKTVIIRGSGVDTTVFQPPKTGTMQTDQPQVLLASRMIWDKGIAEFAEAAAILELLNDPEKMDAMGKAGRRRVLDEFDVRIVTKQTLALYAEMVRL